MAALRREEIRRLRDACQRVSEVAREIRRIRAGLGTGPGYRECRKAEALAIPDSVDASVFRAVHSLDSAVAGHVGQGLREAREAVAYATAAIESRAWNDANADLGRCLAALEDVERRLHREIPAPLGWIGSLGR